MFTRAFRAALAHHLREQSRYPSGQPRISPATAHKIVNTALAELNNSNPRLSAIATHRTEGAPDA